MFDLLSRLLFLKLPLNERMFKFWFDFFEWAFRLLVAAEGTYMSYILFGGTGFSKNAVPMFLLLLLAYLTYIMIHFMNDCESFLKGGE